ncbi:zinc finger CCHC domain-containing protein 8 [Thalassophryne amazonica]|uniref:zinc finger CCHC domain-containing protein 8 n=1 Tax=Thalassophryne amazonica TaxID=390379 RepID=UPI001471BF3F|nr:zinc finger CCHC domain-containing protein 8 [Thalassophryne amazonica]
MAGVDFGDRELFQQIDDSAPLVSTHVRFTDAEDDQEELCRLRERLEECEDRIQRLNDDNQALRRKMNILIRPSGITVQDVGIDGPVVQILYANNLISKQGRQEIEDCICSVILKHQNQGPPKQKSSFHLKPQNSSFAMEEDEQKKSCSSVRTTTEAFKVVGSVLYFTTFCLDRLGQPLLNENPQLTDGWDVPVYHQVFNQVSGTDGQEIEMKDKRPKSLCFNCGSVGHQLRDCTKPKDMAAINERRREFSENSLATQGNQRYHAEEVEERFAKYKPGVMSEELLAALGLDGHTLPPLIYRMRQLGYPPGWLKEAEMQNSGLTLYDGNAADDGATANMRKVSYDVSKLIDFPGFNVPAPQMKDEFLQYGSICMQDQHMKHNLAAYLSHNFPTLGVACNKRQDLDPSPQLRKKIRPSPYQTPDGSDMDIESDPGTFYYNRGPGEFQFQPPLPPGSPGFSTPPPLPKGTPPATPTHPSLPKHTPPHMPTIGSSTPHSIVSTVSDEGEEGIEDDLTLEQLEEQQRQIWAALENADTATNSDCETPTIGTPLPRSPSMATPAHGHAEVDEVVDTVEPTQSINQREPGIQEVNSQNCGQIEPQEDDPQTSEPVKSQDDGQQSVSPIRSQNEGVQNPDPVRFHNDTPQSPNPDLANESAGESRSKYDERVTAVPHRSRFAAGIVPFEDTPEYTEVAEATGLYLRIRDLLKNSPRNFSKKK